MKELKPSENVCEIKGKAGEIICQSLHLEQEFKTLIPPLSLREFKLLEESIIREKGARDPLVIWARKNVLLDGHNRLKICRKHKLPYRETLMEFPDTDAAKAWVIGNQLGRRNLKPKQFTLLLGQKYNLEKKEASDNLKKGDKSPKYQNELSGKDKKLPADTCVKWPYRSCGGGCEDRVCCTCTETTHCNSIQTCREPGEMPVKWHQEGWPLPPEDGENGKRKPARDDSGRPGKEKTTAAKLAKEHGVSESTVKRAGKYAEAVETLTKTIDPELKEKTMKGEAPSQSAIIKAAEVVDPASGGVKSQSRQLPETARREIAKKILSGGECPELDGMKRLSGKLRDCGQHELICAACLDAMARLAKAANKTDLKKASEKEKGMMLEALKKLREKIDETVCFLMGADRRIVGSPNPRRVKL